MSASPNLLNMDRSSGGSNAVLLAATCCRPSALHFCRSGWSGPTSASWRLCLPHTEGGDRLRVDLRRTLLLQLHLEETHCAAVMLACLGWILLGFYSLRVGIYPRPTLIFLIVSSVAAAVTNHMVIYRLIGLLEEILEEAV